MNDVTSYKTEEEAITKVTEINYNYIFPFCPMTKAICISTCKCFHKANYWKVENANYQTYPPWCSCYMLSGIREGE